MNHILNLALGRAAAIVLLWVTSVSGEAAEPDKISLAYCTDCVPFQFADKDDRPAGLIIDIWRLWSERTGIEIDFRTAPWDGTLRMVAEGRADAHAGLFFSEARAKFLEYGATLTKTDTHFFVKKGLPPIETVEELAGHRVGVLTGDFVERFLKKRLPAHDVIGFESYDGIMTALREGKLQIFAADTASGIFHLQNSGLGFDYEFSADRPLYRNDWLVAARKGNTELIKVIDAGMALISQAERHEFEQRWVALGSKGFELTAKDIAILAAVIGIAAVLGVVIWIRMLRRRIELRTGELKTELGQRERAEEALRESESRLREAAQSAEAARERAETALAELKAVQQNLIQAEKMASLGELTAGIAHEIKNPLNFINNFAEISGELLGELKEEIEPVVSTLEKDDQEEVEGLISTLSSNLGKIHEHGQRADSIVKGMLLHSRGGTDEHALTDVNVLAEEALNLAYHGARAQDQQFNVTLERDLDPHVGSIEIVPQEITRVLLNLLGNGFYATQKRRQATQDGAYKPTVGLATRDLGDGIEIRVRDNGIGMSPDVIEKLFTPFFTTKPPGTGTGLGLSISYEIVVQRHNGQFTVDSKEGQYSEIIITLPRQQPGVASAPAEGGSA